MEFNPEDIYQLAATIWEATLGVFVTPSEPGQDHLTPGGRSTAACVQITGAWNGAVLLDCPVPAARRAASVMFDTPQTQLKVTDLQDAVAELANMVGGNIKALLPETCYLSLPSVVEGGDYSARVPGSRKISQVQFDCELQTVRITVLEKTDQRAAA